MSTTTPPVERPPATTKKLTPVGAAVYARGSSSWAWASRTDPIATARQSQSGAY